MSDRLATKLDLVFGDLAVTVFRGGWGGKTLFQTCVLQTAETKFTKAKELFFLKHMGRKSNQVTIIASNIPLALLPVKSMTISQLCQPQCFP